MPGFSEILGANGPLASSISGFNVRPQQQAFAEAVGRAIAEGYSLVAEAGTGVGKTFAYLVPALLSGKQVVISTGTRHLQDQLFFKDLPVIQDAIGMPASIALLKGRANYLCLYRLEQARTQPLLQGSADADELAAVEEWSQLTKRGDINELDSVPESSPSWAQVTSTAENCLGQKCTFWEQCHVVKARRAAQNADIVVINHHLMLADLVLKEEGFGEILPGADVVVVDEAHQFPDTAAQHFGVGVSSRQLRDLVRDTRAEYENAKADLPAIPETLHELEAAVSACREHLGTSGQKVAWKPEHGLRPAEKQFSAVLLVLQQLLNALEGLEGHTRGIDNCIARCERIYERLENFLGKNDESEVRWVETFRSGFSMNTVPLDPAEKLAAIWETYRSSWIFTSATLAVNRDLQHFLNRIGMPEAETEILDSPFDYANNTLMYLPEDMPAPSEHGHTEKVVDVAVKFIDAAGGGVFLLFTSFRALNHAAERIAKDYPELFMLVQGQAPKNSLLNEFRAHGDAVLLGTTSFWEGVDVKGAALRLVLIDKLPFASPGDPRVAARIDACRQRGGNPFAEFQLPQAVIGLKQGIGRLVRGSDDRGLFVLCDPRVMTKPYGKLFLNSLPPIPTTRSEEQAIRFMKWVNDQQHRRLA